MGSIYLIILALLLALQSSAEVVTRTVKFIGRDRFNILTKFAIGEENTGRFEIKGRFVTPFDNSENKRKLDVLFYEDSNLKLALQSDDCFKRKHFNNTYSEIMITEDGKWSQSLGIEISPKTETHVWFVTVVDCEGIMHLTNRFMPSLEFEITMLNRNSHFSHEDRFTFTIYSVLLIVHVLLFSKIILNYLINKETKESIFINSKRMIMIGLIADFCCIFLTLIHLYFFSNNGEGVFILTVLSRLCYAISQITTVWTLLMIAYCWRISFKKTDDKDFSVILMIFVFMIHSIIAALTFIDREDLHKYHDISCMQGVIIFVLRFLIFSAFIYGIVITYSSNTKTEKSKIIIFGLVSTCYLLAFPGALILSSEINEYNRKFMVVFCSYLIQMLSIYWIVAKFYPNYFISNYQKSK